MAEDDPPFIRSSSQVSDEAYLATQTLFNAKIASILQSDLRMNQKGENIMGCLFVIIMGAVSAAMIYFFGYSDWVLIVLGLLGLASLVASVIGGHTGFGGGGNTDLQIVIAGLGIAAAIILPNYNAHQPCSQAKTALSKLAEAEEEYFSEHKTYIAGLNLLNLKQNPDVQLKVSKADDKSYTASASHNLCKNEKDGTPKVLMWDSTNGGLQN